MKKINKLILLASLLLSFSVRAFFIPERYKNGQEVCLEHAAEISAEKAVWVSVPIDYTMPELGSTQIYAYTKKVFNPDLPSVIFFTGGPGVSSRSAEFELPDFNVIFFEQRGISCSRPESKTLFLNPKFYSSENTARDALAVI